MFGIIMMVRELLGGMGDGVEMVVTSSSLILTPPLDSKRIKAESETLTNIRKKGDKAKIKGETLYV